MGFEGMGEDIFGGNERAKDLNKSDIDGSTFFDENESRHGGSHVDEATGKAYDNDRDMDAESPEMHATNTVIDINNHTFEEEDEVTQLLRDSFKDHPNRDEELLKLNIDPRVK